MSKQFDSRLDGPRPWHSFDLELSNQQIRSAIAAIGLEVQEIIREAGVVFILADRERHGEIRAVLNRGSMSL
jgi:hypothetical protein